jgi:hypothetical protein
MANDARSGEFGECAVVICRDPVKSPSSFSTRDLTQFSGGQLPVLSQKRWDVEVLRFKTAHRSGKLWTGKSADRLPRPLWLF